MNGILDALERILLKTAYPMTPPKLFGAFHLCALFLCVAVPLTFSFLLRKTSFRIRVRLLFCVGVLLLVMEAYKQLFFYLIVDDRVYDVWLFPFQLCSIPMYLCVALPFLPERAQKIIATFLVDYSFYGALFALLFPEGLMRPYLFLTLHGFVWHALLIFVAGTAFVSGMADASVRAFFDATAALLFFCVVATALNLFLEGRGALWSYPDLFYLSPFHASTQPVVSDVEASLGRPFARALYVAGMIAFGAVSHGVYAFYARRRKES